MHPPHTIARYRNTIELGFAGCEEGNVLLDQKRRVELQHLFDIARIAWDA
jgi:hypothetical protein